jgi:uncharacterized protein YegP (UPF0339 family)
MKRTNSTPDEIIVYTLTDSPASSRWRWTRRTKTNYKIVGASSEGYARKDGALRNIARTQREPYTIKIDALGE